MRALRKFARRGAGNLVACLSSMTTFSVTMLLMALLSGAAMEGQTVTPSTLPGGIVGTFYQQVLSVTSGTTSTTWSVGSGLPPGLSVGTLSTGDGVVIGTPTQGGSFTFTVSSQAPVASQEYTIVIASTITITTTSLPSGVVGVAYLQTLQASGATSAVTWAIASGSLPQGLAINSTTGVISGGPQSAGTSTFTVSATYTPAGTPITATKQLSITIAPPALTIQAPSLSGTVNQAVSGQFTASGGTPPYTFSHGTLPAGIQISTSGAVTGAPTQSGSFTFTVTTMDAQMQTASVTVAMAVAAAVPPAVPVLTITTTATSGTVPPGQQPKVSISIASAYSSTLTGMLTISFSGGGTEVHFADNSTSTTFTITAGQTAATFNGGANVTAIAGTVGGTITLTVSQLKDAGNNDVTPSPAPTATLVVNTTPPVITSVKITTTPGTGFSIAVTGFSSTRDMSTALFHFTATQGTTLNTTDFTVQVGTAFAAWYTSAASLQFGSQFTLTVPFTVQGTTFPIAAVTVTLTNSKGAGTPSQPVNP